MASKKKLVTSVAAVATAAAMVLGGTFAWQSINQTALNEASDVVNPGGRLHNDMWYVSETENNNDIYVENFAKEAIFARVRLSEYMEVVLNKGTAGELEKQLIGSKTPVQQTGENGDPAVDADGNPVYTGEYTYDYQRVTDYSVYDETTGTMTAGVDARDVADGGDGTAYWTWKIGGWTTYIPTFNMNKDSLEPDLRGLYRDRVGGISNRGADQYVDAYGDMITDVPTESKTANEIWDYDSDMDDELKDLDAVALTKLIDGAADAPAYDADAVKLVENQTHDLAYTAETTQLISMSEWLEMVGYDETTGEALDYDPDIHSTYWVYDDTEDLDGDGVPDGNGWVYWSAALAGGEATGLLLDGTVLNQVMDDTWYYAIEAVGQFCTPDDIGEPAAATYSLDDTDTGTGFYRDGETVTAQALEFLRIIGMTDTTPGYDEEDPNEPDEPEQTYNMHTYVYEGEEFIGDASYLVPGKKYTVVVHAEQNEYDDASVSYSVKMQDGTGLTSGTDYTLSNTTAVIGTELDEQGYYHTTPVKLTILKDSLVGETIVVEAVADQTGNVAASEYAVHYEQKDVDITLYDANGVAVAGTNHGGTLVPNATYDIVATIPNAVGEDVVIYSTLDSQPVPDNIEVVDITVYAHAGDYTNVNKVDSGGTNKLIVGDAETFDCDEWMDDGITNEDALTLAVGADIVRIYESADAKSSGAEPTEIYYTYGQWDLYPTGQELYQVSVDDVLYISQGDHSDIIVVLDGNDANISAGVTYQLEGNTDTNTKIEKSPATEDHLDEAILTFGEEETATELTITASIEGKGEGSKTVSVAYLDTLYIGDTPADLWGTYIDSSNTTTKTVELSLVNYWGEAVEGVSYAISGANLEGTKVEGNVLTLAAGENASPMYLSVTVDEVTTDYDVWVTAVDDTTVPSITVADGSDDTLNSLTDTVRLQLNDYDGTADWSADSPDVTVTPDESGVATVAFKNFEGTEAPSAYKYTITAAYEDGTAIATYAVKFAPATYTPVHAEINDPMNGTYRRTEITSDTINLNANRYVGYFFIKETAQVNWVATNILDTSSVISEYSAFDESQLEQGNTYSVQANYAKPDGTTGAISFTVSVEESDLEM